MMALKMLYNDNVLNGGLEKLHTFQLCQDHLETWFSCVRRSLGKIEKNTFILSTTFFFFSFLTDSTIF